ncbi:MAG: hypothetical protein WD873_04145 [Candidatus Hydrogenedentales bacterium]
MKPNNSKKKRFRSALLVAAAVLVVAAASAAGASGWVASAQDSVEAFFQRDEFRALAAVLSTAQPEDEAATVEPTAQPATLVSASLCWWETFIQ